MAQQTVSIGSSANDGTGDPLRTAFTKINTNFTELYGTTAEANDLIEDTSPQLGGMLDVNGNHIGDGTLELLKFSETGSIYIFETDKDEHKIIASYDSKKYKREIKKIKY